MSDLKTCENCNNSHNGDYGSGRFCAKKCASSFSTKDKRSLINEKVSKTLTKEPYLKVCVFCKNTFYTKRKHNIHCSVKCGNLNTTDEKREKCSNASKKRCSTLEERLRMKEIGRLGGFGTKGQTKLGTRYDSNFEKKCFEYLEDLCIYFEPHKSIPNSSKVSDIYLPCVDIWIELDGINREKRKEWLGKQYQYWLNKLTIYTEQNLTYKIIYTFKEFEEYMEDVAGSNPAGCTTIKQKL
jgi:hypothetical protein